MTVPYSVTDFGIKEQIRKMGTKIKKKNKTYYQFKSISNDTLNLNLSEIMVLAKLIRSIILDYYPNLDLLFKYYGKMTDLLIKLKLPILWTTPNGMIIQNYFKSKKEVFTHQLNRKKHKFILKERIEPNILDTVKSKRGIVPNVIHSMDSSHLNLIVKEFIKNDLFILTIHDCFIINPNDFLLLFNSVRDKFIEIYAGKSY
jgi:DNA-directed RNA polymerase